MLRSAAIATTVTTRRSEWLGEGRQSSPDFMGSLSVAAHTLTGCHAALRRERRIIQVELRTAVISRQEDERGLSIICEIRRQPRLAILAFCPTGVKSLLWKFFFDDLY